MMEGQNVLLYITGDCFEGMLRLSLLKFGDELNSCGGNMIVQKKRVE